MGAVMASAVSGEILFVHVPASGGLAVAVVPAVAPAVTLTAVSAAAAYGAVSIWCQRHEITEATLDIHEIAVDKLSDKLYQIDQALLD